MPFEPVALNIISIRIWWHAVSQAPLPGILIPLPRAWQSAFLEVLEERSLRKKPKVHFLFFTALYFPYFESLKQNYSKDEAIITFLVTGKYRERIFP